MIRRGAILVLALLAPFGAPPGAVAKALVAPNIASGIFSINDAESARPTTSQLIDFAIHTGGCIYNFASGRPKWPSRDPIEENGGANLYAFLENSPYSGVDGLGLVATAKKRPTRNCTTITKRHQIQLASAELLQQGVSIFNATARGTVDITFTGERCEECCKDDDWKQVDRLTASLSLAGTLNVTLGLNFRFGIPSGNVSGWAGIRGEATFSAGGSGELNIGGCSPQSSVTICLTTTDISFSLIGGGQAMGRLGKWRIELAGATVTGSATMASSNICFSCSGDGCAFAGIRAGAFEVNDELSIAFTLFGTSYVKRWKAF